ncbi:MAG: hypothetical protein RR060_06465, partial [Victivallaceae bacterium]
DMLNQELSSLIYSNQPDSELANAPLWLELKPITGAYPALVTPANFTVTEAQKSAYPAYEGKAVPAIHFIARSAMSNDGNNELSVIEYTYLPPRVDGELWPGALNADGDDFAGGVLLRKELPYSLVTNELIGDEDIKKNILNTLGLGLTAEEIAARAETELNQQLDSRIFNIFAFDSNELKRHEYDLVIDCITSFNLIGLKINPTTSKYEAIQLMGLASNNDVSLTKPENWSDISSGNPDNISGTPKPDMIKIELKMLPRKNYVRWLSLKQRLAAADISSKAKDEINKEIAIIENSTGKTFSKIITIPAEGGSL